MGKSCDWNLTRPEIVVSGQEGLAVATSLEMWLQ